MIRRRALYGGIREEDKFKYTNSVVDYETITIPATGTNDFIVDWGDGSSLEHITDISPTHLYTNVGNYQISIWGEMNSFGFELGGSELNVLSIDQTGQTNLYDIESLAYGCINCTSITYTPTDTIVTGIRNLANGCSSLVTFNGFLDIKNEATLCESLFRNCHSLVADFSGAYFPNCTTSAAMFYDASPNIVIDNLIFDKPVNADSMLRYTDIDLDLTTWTISPTNLLYFLENNDAITIADFTTWDMSNCTNLTRSLQGCNLLTTVDIRGCQFLKLTSMNQWVFSSNSITNIYTIGADAPILSSCTSIMTAPLVESFDFTFLSGNITNAYGLTTGANSLLIANGLSSLDFSNNTNATSMFSSNYVLPLSQYPIFNFSPTSASAMFYRCYAVKDLDLTLLNMSNCTNARYMFNLANLDSILGLASFDMSNVTDVSRMFGGNLSLDLEGIQYWTMSSMEVGNEFCNSTLLPTSLYDQILDINTGWISRGMIAPTGDLDLGFGGNSKYSLSNPDVVAGRAAIEALGWIITDGGGI